jgi:hypothetical protein
VPGVATLPEPVRIAVQEAYGVRMATEGAATAPDDKAQDVR